MNDTFTKDQIIEAYNNAPGFVRTAFNAESTTRIIMGLQTKFQLHIDQAGTLGREVGYLLVGLIDPEKFAHRLKNSGFSDATVSEISKELNEKIFKPIRQEEEKSGMGVPVLAPAKPAMPIAAPRPTAPAAPAPRPVAPVVAAPRPVIVPSVPATPVVAAPSPVVATPRPVVVAAPHIAPLPPKTVMPSRASGSLGDIVRSVIQTPLPAPKAAERINLLEDHEEPHIDLNKAPSPVPAAPVAPVVPPAPVNLPGAMPSYVIPTEVRPGPAVPPVAAPVAPKPVFTAPMQQKPVAPAVPPAPVAPYSSDPYREPIDDVGE